MHDGQTLLHLMSAQDYAQACGAFADYTINDELRVLSVAENEPLPIAMLAARTKMGAGAWVWTGRETDISTIEAATCALQGLITHGRKAAPPGPFFLH